MVGVRSAKSRRLCKEETLERAIKVQHLAQIHVKIGAYAQGDNLFQLLGARFAPDPTAYMLLAALVMIPTVWLPDQKALSYLGFCGIAATLTVSAAVVFTFLSGAPAPDLAARRSSLERLSRC